MLSHSISIKSFTLNFTCTLSRLQDLVLCFIIFTWKNFFSRSGLRCHIFSWVLGHPVNLLRVLCEVKDLGADLRTPTWLNAIEFFGPFQLGVKTFIAIHLTWRSIASSLVLKAILLKAVVLVGIPLVHGGRQGHAAEERCMLVVVHRCQLVANRTGLWHVALVVEWCLRHSRLRILVSLAFDLLRLFNFRSYCN